MQAKEVRGATTTSALTVFIFDDGATFEYLDSLRSEAVVFIECRSFADIEAYLCDIATGDAAPPEVVALDLFCDDYTTFELLGSDEVVDHGACGVQLLSRILPPHLPKLSEVPAIVFSSFPEKVKHLSLEQEARDRGGATKVCTRSEFEECFRKIILAEGVRDIDFVEEYLPRDLTQQEYFRLFCVLSDELKFSDEERAKFVQSVSKQNSISEIFSLTTWGNKRVDALLGINLALDQFLTTASKREYLETQTMPNSEMSLLDGILEGSEIELDKVKRLLEHRLGGEIVL